uniref:SURF1-like protein n=1 Tax=Arion vulgaris TaxID=1028688 RepID=A0A0B6ZME8_9EUPU
MNGYWVKSICIKPSRVHRNVFKFKDGLRYLSQEIQAGKAPRQTPRERPAVKRKSTGSGYPLLIIPLTAFALGTWQVRRREWKLNLIKELEDKMKEPPVPLPENLDLVNSMEYQKVTFRGVFDHTHELFIGPRTDVRADELYNSANRGQSGVNVVTPFKLSDRDETILVNRGYVQFKDRPPQARPEGQIEGEVEITGVIRLNDRKSILPNDPFKDGYWLTRNIDEMANIAGTAKVFVDADSNSTVPGGPRGGQTRVALRNEHAIYIFTWYSLCALTFFLWHRNYRSLAPHKTVLDYIKREHKRM